MTGWLPEAVELEAYEGLRRGDEHAFRLIAEPLQPTLRRLARVYVDAEASVDAVLLHSWEIALHGLGMFCWRTPLATWIASITVACGRPRHDRAGAPPPRPSVPVRAAPGPEDWSDLPWGPRWEHAGATLERALAALPLRQREVIHGRDAEQWPAARVRAVYGLPEATYRELLAEAHIRLHDSFALLVGQTGRGHRAARIAVISAWLGSRVDDRPRQLDPRTLAVFHRWAATGHTGWQRLSRQLRPVSA